VLSKPSPSRRAAELRLIDEAIAGGRCRRITAAEAIAYDLERATRLPPRSRGFREVMEQEARARAAHRTVQV
jgi:hypothetical protein